MKLTACLLALVGAASGLVISPPAVPRAGVVTRHRALFMQEDDDQTKRRHQRNTLPMLRHSATLLLTLQPLHASLCF
jgi:hypothetical protein